MGYYATCSGEIAIAQNLTEKQIDEICDEARKYSWECQMFDRRRNERTEVDLYYHDKYHDCDILDFLTYVAENYPITDGCIECIGEDDARWRFIWKDGEWVEEDGEIVYEGDLPKTIDGADCPEFIGQIIDIFEDFLEAKEITIDNPEKEEAVADGEDPDNIAILYGSDYDALYESIKAQLKNWGIVKEAK